MDRIRSQPGHKALNSQSRARHRHMSDDDLDMLAKAFGSHLIRNCPPREGAITTSRIDWKPGSK